MDKCSPDTRFLVTSATLIKFFDDKVALAHMQTKRFHVLNPTATLIWKSVSTGSSIAEIEQVMGRHFDVDQEELSASIHEALITLNSEDFIQIQS